MSVPVSASIPAPRRSAENPAEPEHFEGVGPSARALAIWREARTCLHGAEHGPTPGERYLVAYLAAVRAATAVIADRGGQRHGARPVSVWRLLTDNAPEFREWAAFFAAGAQQRAAAETGANGVSSDAAEEILQRSGEFLHLTGRSLLGTAR